MKLSDYAKQHDVTYRTAWNRFYAGKIPGAYQDEMGHIIVPSRSDELSKKAVIYARVSTHGQKDDLERQAERLKDFAIQRGYEVVEVVKEIGSGVSDTRTKLTTLLGRHQHWGTLIVEHKDRLTRVGFGWWPTFLAQLDKELVVVDMSEDSDEGRMEDIFSILYSYAASEYGKREARNRANKALELLESDN